jgi:response regulator RpfG family c-di-GMP phosphodiesterase
MNTVRVLCIENQVDDLATLRRLLEMAGYEVVSASTGKQGLLLLATQSIQAVLVEYDLPDIAGDILQAEIRRIKPDVPTLLFAGGVSQTSSLIRFFDAYFRSINDVECEAQVRRSDNVQDGPPGETQSNAIEAKSPPSAEIPT